MKRFAILALIASALTFILGLAVLVSEACAGHLYPERDYQAAWCAEHHGIMEYRLDNDRRVDCLTDSLAVEHDFAAKWFEGVMQALHYAMKTNRRAAVVLIVEHPGEGRHVQDCRETVAFYGLPVDVLVMEQGEGR